VAPLYLFSLLLLQRWYECSAMMNFINYYSALATTSAGGAVLDTHRMMLSDNVAKLYRNEPTCGDGGIHCYLLYPSDAIPCDKCVFQALIYVHYLMIVMGQHNNT